MKCTDTVKPPSLRFLGFTPSVHNRCFASMLSSVLIFIYSAPSGHGSSVVPCSTSGTAGLKQTKGPCYTSCYTPCNTSLTFAKQKQQNGSPCHRNERFIFHPSPQNVVERLKILRIRVIALKIATFLKCLFQGSLLYFVVVWVSHVQCFMISEMFLKFISVSSYLNLEEENGPLLSVEHISFAGDSGVNTKTNDLNWIILFLWIGKHKFRCRFQLVVI